MSDQPPVSLFHHFSCVEDPRIERNKRHLLLEDPAYPGAGKWVSSAELRRVLSPKMTQLVVCVSRNPVSALAKISLPSRQTTAAKASAAEKSTCG